MNAIVPPSGEGLGVEPNAVSRVVSAGAQIEPEDALEKLREKTMPSELGSHANEP